MNRATPTRDNIRSMVRSPQITRVQDAQLPELVETAAGRPSRHSCATSLRDCDSDKRARAYEVTYVAWVRFPRAMYASEYSLHRYREPLEYSCLPLPAPQPRAEDCLR